MLVFFLFKQKTAYELRISDWSSDVCSSDLPGYSAAVAAAAQPVIEAAGGGAFMLCTSHRALRQIAEQLRAKLKLRVLVQGEDSRSALLDAFADDGNAVLVGTSSFWEGVDVKGSALRVVIIDRLPFAARSEEHTSELQSLMRISYAVFCL